MRIKTAAVTVGLALVLALPTGSAAAAQVFVNPGQDGGLVVDRDGPRLVMVTGWRESEGTCFVGDRRGGVFRGTVAALPGSAAASVRLRWLRVPQGRRLVVRTIPEELYSTSIRRWKPASVLEWRRVVGLGQAWTPARALRGC